MDTVSNRMDTVSDRIDRQPTLDRRLETKRQETWPLRGASEETRLHLRHPISNIETDLDIEPMGF